MSGSKSTHRSPDVLVRNADSVWLFCPMTARARSWFEENVAAEPWQTFGPTVAVEHRYALGLLRGLHDDGFVLR
jgi:hypothetical protein